MERVGLGHLPLGRPTSSLSGGEGQRLRLARELARPRGGKTLFLLDEPGCGLHPKDISGLIRVLEELTHSGHTVVVAEHRVELLRSLDWLIELSGLESERLVYEGPPGGEWPEHSEIGPFITKDWRGDT